VNLSFLSALAAAAFLGSGCGGEGGGGSEASSDGSAAGSPAQGDNTFVEDDFSDPVSGWARDDDDAVLLDYADGGYRVLMKAPGPRDARLTFGAGDVQAVSVEADATERAGPYILEQPDDFEFHGVACWGAGADSNDLEFGYKFVLTPEGHYGILRDDQSEDGLVILAEGDGDFGGYGATNRIRGECRTRDGRSTLVLHVDGKKIAEARDPDGPDRFPAIGLTAETSEAGTDIHFDNVLAWNSLAGRPSRTEPAPEASPEPFPETKPAPMGLCTRAGIRYSGTTAQRGEVCFTVTRDHSRLLELGFRFVRANQCPGMATGTYYVEGEAGPTVTRDRVRSSGFTGDIEGTEATGILQDWDICKERTFAWRARRVR
jgi:hypothetical protein